jgi:peptidoglycan/xylan/chitin deacetylase (PgdA/CDA1 family)
VAWRSASAGLRRLRRMLEPGSLAARRAGRQAQLRRRRLTGAGMTVALVVIGLVAVVALAHGHPGVRHAGRLTVARRAQVKVKPPSLVAIGDANIRRLAQLGLPVYCGGRHGSEVAFTFDDGPGVYTHYAVKKLTEAHEQATFFVVGKSMDAWPGWLPKEVKLGAIGDHTYTHPVLTELSPSEITSEIERAKVKIEAASAQPVYLFRPPYGAHDPTVDRIVKQLGLLEIMWSVDSQDSLGADWAGIIRNVEAGLYPGAIIEMHENRGQTIRALTTLLPELQRQHMRSVSLPELFATDPPSVAQLRGGEAACGGPAPPALTGS